MESIQISMLDFFDNLGDLVFGNKRLDGLKHFATSKDFQMRRKVKAEQLPIDMQGMHFFDGKRR